MQKHVQKTSTAVIFLKIVASLNVLFSPSLFSGARPDRHPGPGGAGHPLDQEERHRYGALAS